MAEGKIIEINGKLYDSYGQLINNESGAISANKTPKKIRPAHAPPNNKKRSVQRSSTLIRKAVKKPNAGQVDNEPNTTNGKAVKKTNTGKDGKAPQEPNDKDDQVTKESKASNGNVDKSVKGQVAKGGKLISKKSKIIKNKKT